MSTNYIYLAGYPSDQRSTSVIVILLEEKKNLGKARVVA